MTSAAKASNPIGLKRICVNCGTRFYDLNERPIICPSCETEFTGEIKVKSRRGRSGTADKKGAPYKEDEEMIRKRTMIADREDSEYDLLDDDEELEVVSLEDAEDEKPDPDEEDEDVLDGSDLDDIPDFGDDLEDDLGDDDDTLLDEDDD